MTGVDSKGSAGATLQTLDLEPGYYRTSETSRNVLECHREEACVGGSNASQYCAPGYQDACKYPSLTPHSGLVVACARFEARSVCQKPYRTSVSYVTPDRPLSNVYAYDFLRTSPRATTTPRDLHANYSFMACCDTTNRSQYIAAQTDESGIYRLTYI